jgi:hypothetical protein
MNRFSHWFNTPLIGLILLYKKFISPLLGNHCRFHPSCSTYGLQAFQSYHPLKAFAMTAWRIMRCNPFNPGGFDPLPQPGEPWFPRTRESDKEDGGR